MSSTARFNWRLLAWGGMGLLLAVPAVAMLFTSEVRWDAADFIGVGTVFGSIGLAFELLLRRGVSLRYLSGCLLATGAALVQLWVALAVGIIGAEDNPANLIFGCVIAVALVGVAGAGLRAAGMARAMLAAAVAQILVLAIVLTGPAVAEGETFVRGILLLTAVLVMLWLGAAWLFRGDARRAMLGE